MTWCIQSYDYFATHKQFRRHMHVNTKLTCTQLTFYSSRVYSLQYRLNCWYHEFLELIYQNQRDILYKSMVYTLQISSQLFDIIPFSGHWILCVEISKSAWKINIDTNLTICYHSFFEYMEFPVLESQNQHQTLM